MKTIDEQTNSRILKTIGENLELIRLEAQIPDSDVIRRGGIKRDSWYNLKSGENVTMVNFIRALRGLDRMDLLKELLEYENSPGPMDLVQEKKQTYPKRIRSRNTNSSGDFQWGDEK